MQNENPHGALAPQTLPFVLSQFSDSCPWVLFMNAHTSSPFPTSSDLCLFINSFECVFVYMCMCVFVCACVYVYVYICVHVC